MNENVNNDLMKHMEEEYSGDNQPKSKPQKLMEPYLRQKTIQNMLAKGNLNIGVGPITSEHIARVETILLEMGVLKSNEIVHSEIISKELGCQISTNGRLRLGQHGD